jgi:hypothetical protein
MSADGADQAGGLGVDPRLAGWGQRGARQQASGDGGVIFGLGGGEGLHSALLQTMQLLRSLAGTTRVEDGGLQN